MDSESPYLPVQGAGDSKEVARSTWIKSLNYYFDLWFSRSVGRFSDWPGFLSKTLHHVAPRMVPKPSFRSCHKRRLISTGTGELHLWIVSAAGAESLNAQRWTQSPDLCSYNWNPGTRSLFFFSLQTVLLMDVFMSYESFLWRLISSHPPTYPQCQ